MAQRSPATPCQYAASRDPSTIGRGQRWPASGASVSRNEFAGRAPPAVRRPGRAVTMECPVSHHPSRDEATAGLVRNAHDDLRHTPGLSGYAEKCSLDGVSTPYARVDQGRNQYPRYGTEVEYSADTSISRNDDRAWSQKWLGRWAEALIINLIGSALWVFLLEVFQEHHLRWTYPRESVGTALNQLNHVDNLNVPGQIFWPVLIGVEVTCFLIHRASSRGKKGFDLSSLMGVGFFLACFISLTFYNASRGIPLLSRP